MFCDGNKGEVELRLYALDTPPFPGINTSYRILNHCVRLTDSSFDIITAFMQQNRGLASRRNLA